MNNEVILYTIIGFGSFITLLLGFPYVWKGLNKLSPKTRYNGLGTSSKIRLVRQLHEAVEYLSSTKTGAIITIVKKQPLDNFRTDGITINANIASDLIIALFQKNSPLHDGAIIIDNNKITYVGTYYKITSTSMENKLGARHRAALGISDQTDALTIVVSEETGNIHFTIASKMIKVKLSDFQEKLTKYIS